MSISYNMSSPFYSINCTAYTGYVFCSKGFICICITFRSPRNKEIPGTYLSANDYYYSVRYNHKAISKNQFHAGCLRENIVINRTLNQ